MQRTTQKTHSIIDVKILDFEQAPAMFAIANENLETQVKLRMQRLLLDLANNDMCMAFLDLGQLQRVVSGMAPENLARVRAQCTAQWLGDVAT